MLRAGNVTPVEPDVLGAPYERQTIDLGRDDEGPVVATLVRRLADRPSRRAVLYVHGFSDYFFQRHMAERFAAEGYAFHALDLRKHGRSLREHQHPNFCKSVSEYYADITRAIDVIGAPVLVWLMASGLQESGGFDMAVLMTLPAR